MAELQDILWISGIICEVLLVGIVSRKNAARNVPTFLVYLYWAVLIDVGATLLYHPRSTSYLTFYGIQCAIESLLLIAVLFDLTRAAMRPLPTSVSRGLLGIMAFLTVSLGAILWWLTDSWVLLSGHREFHLVLRGELTASILRVFLLLFIGGLIEFLGRHCIPIGWSEHELQIATGMGVYALASLAQSLATTYQRFMTPASYLATTVAVGWAYELCLVYWIFCFTFRNKAAKDQSAKQEAAEPGSGPSSLWLKGIEGDFAEASER